ncbi:hypothetical protein NA57DRAFT_67515 [Rhizodiscina lignyota]|uniref:FAD-dependent oxidoreductase 2 FAD-binding domain-containing protein n=1 Tax=Rhizodiscina lignyota TaxID=1504668 RepID=A0A9P4M5Y6_9PEZI|nr:hypothetical protein NA57DRAFT_67515 [Rhizodiscina lignyota]
MQGSAATTAAKNRARVALVEKAPEDNAGRNTYFTPAGFRCCFDGLPDLLPFLYQSNGTKSLSDDLVKRIEMAPYTKEDFHADINRVTKGRADPVLANVLVDNSRDAIQWLVGQGAKFMLSFNRQAFNVDDKSKFWGGMVMNMIGQGKELFKLHNEWTRKTSVTIFYCSPAIELLTDDSAGDITGIKALQHGRYRRFGASGGVVLASGGFQASPALRSKYLGPGWDLCASYGCHSVAWDANSPVEEGNHTITNQYTKSGYPLGLMLNTPQGIAFQIWDAEQAKWLRIEEYADDVTQNIRTNTLDELADKLVAKGLKDKAQFLATISEYNEAVDAFSREKPHHKFDPAIRDGMSTQSQSRQIMPAKSSWATSLKTPFYRRRGHHGNYIHIRRTGRRAILGGLLWDNYPGGSGLMMGTVLGRIARKKAAARAEHVRKGSSAHQRAQL